MGVIDARDVFILRKRLVCQLAQDSSNASRKVSQRKEDGGKCLESKILVEDPAGDEEALQQAAISLIKDLTYRMKPDRKH